LRTNKILVRPDQKKHKSAHYFLSKTAFSACTSCALASGKSFFFKARRKRITTSASIPLRVKDRKFSLTILLILFLSTAPGISLLLTVIPSRAHPARLLWTCTANQRVVCALCLRMAEKPCWRDILLLRGKKARSADLDAQSCTAFGSSGRYNSTSALGFHAHQKTVGAFSFGYGRLECAFHNLILDRVC